MGHLIGTHVCVSKILVFREDFAKVINDLSLRSCVCASLKVLPNPHVEDTLKCHPGYFEALFQVIPYILAIQTLNINLNFRRLLVESSNSFAFT